MSVYTRVLLGCPLLGLFWECPLSEVSLYFIPLQAYILKAGHVPQTKLHQKLIQATQVIIALVRDKKQLTRQLTQHINASLGEKAPLAHKQSEHSTRKVDARIDHPQIPLATHLAQNTSSQSASPQSSRPNMAPPESVPLEDILPQARNLKPASVRVSTGKPSKQEVMSSDIPPFQACGPSAPHLVIKLPGRS